LLESERTLPWAMGKINGGGGVRRSGEAEIRIANFAGISGI
jgi:hypothetical protein